MSGTPPASQIRLPPEWAQRFKEALALHRSGRLDEAEAHYRAILAVEPRFFGCLHLLGIVESQKGRFEAALACFDAAIEAEPRAADVFNNRGNVLKELHRWNESIESYGRALALKPDYAEAFANRANALREASRLDDALADYAQAIALRPDHAGFHVSRGNALKEVRRPVEALAAYDHAIALQPDSAEAHCGRGDTLRLLGRTDEAVESYGRAIALKPDYAEAFNNRGVALFALNRLSEAAEDCDRAIALDPARAEALNNRGVVRFALERFAEAAEDYGRALALKPDYAEALYNNALALEKLSRFNDALTSLDRAIALNPDYPEAHNLRGNLLCALMQWEKALASYDRAVALAPAYADAVNNRGVALLQMKRLDEAIESHTRAIALKPDFAEAYYKRGLAKLLAGRFREGWADAEWRGRIEATVAERPKLALPEWRDEPPVGRRILVYAEQGWGDTIQFCRYLPLLAERGAKVTFLAPTRLLRLLKPLDETVRLIDAAHDQGLFDFQCALMSLPHRLGTDLENVPNRVPYLAAEKALADTWRARLGEGLKIGIAWQGNPKGGVDRGRSVPLGAFFPLARVSGARLIALQKNDGLEQLADLPPDVRIETPPAPFDEGPDAFVDSAAIMAALDLIVTTDTAIAHLAGALNRPVWLALRYVPDWRWLLEREDSPWYSGMRLFRQETPGDWTPMFARMAQELAALAKR